MRLPRLPVMTCTAPSLSIKLMFEENRIGGSHIGSTECREDLEIDRLAKCGWMWNDPATLSHICRKCAVKHDIGVRQQRLQLYVRDTETWKLSDESEMLQINVSEATQLISERHGYEKL